jgi:acetoin utilization deacetylase AcuC-like enzyme
MSNLVHSPEYNTDLSAFGIFKPFALDRGTKVLHLLEEEFGEQIQVAKPTPISKDDVRLVHTQRYLESLDQVQTWLNIFELKDEEYKPKLAKRPLPDLFDDIALKCGGTKLAAINAFKYGLAANLGGGYHHAFPDRGRGFCVIHDIAIAIKSCQKADLANKVLVVDLDFHQGDGTAVVFRNDDSVFTLSVHSEEGWPDEKQKSDLDVPILESETKFYLEKTEQAVTEALKRFSPDLVMYVAGSDPYEHDVLPGTKFIKLTLDEMFARDKFVIDTFEKLGVPLAMVYAGGYGDAVWQVHYNATRHLWLKSRGAAIDPA